LGADRAELVCCRLLHVVGGDEIEAALGEDFEAEVAAAVGPLVVLLGQDGADESDDGAAVGEDVGAAADLAVEAFVGVARPDLAPECFPERREGQDVGAGGVEVVVDLGQAGGDLVEQLVVLGMDGSGFRTCLEGRTRSSGGGCYVQAAPRGGAAQATRTRRGEPI
jgi:hypothetical protein